MSRSIQHAAPSRLPYDVDVQLHPDPPCRWIYVTAASPVALQAPAQAIQWGAGIHAATMPADLGPSL
jgi:hypothetical protein